MKQQKLCTCDFGGRIGCRFYKIGFHPTWLICGHIGEED